MHTNHVIESEEDSAMEIDVVKCEETKYSDDENDTTKDAAMDTSSCNDTEELEAPETADEETDGVTIMRKQPGDAGVFITVRQNQVFFTGHAKQVKTAYRKVKLSTMHTIRGLVEEAGEA